jgi:outer membrane protein TolC
MHSKVFNKMLYLTLICVFLFSIPVKSLSDTITIEQMQNWVEASPDIKIAQQEYHIAKAKVDLSQSALSPTLFGTITYTNYSNPVESSSYDVTNANQNGSVSLYRETLTPIQQRYNNVSMNVGINIPLFGSRQALKRDLDLSKSALNQSNIDIELKKWQSIKALRYAYAEYYVRAIQIQLANEYLNNKEQIQKILQSRQQARLLLKSDKIELDTQFYVVERNKSVYEKQLNDALNILEMLTGRNLSNFKASSPKFNTDCVSNQILLNAINENPQIKLYEEKYQGYSKVFSEGNSIFSYGQLSLSTGIQNNFQNSIGWNVGCAVTVNMPLLEKKWHDANVEKTYYERLKSEKELEYQKQLYRNAVDSYSFWLKSRQENVKFAQKRLEAAMEAYKIAQLRDVVNPGDTIYNIIKSKYNLYQVSNDYLESLLDLKKAQADILGLDNNLHCSDQLDQNTSIIDNIMRVFKNPLFVKESNDFSLGFYEWDGLQLYKTLGDKTFWQSLPQTNRIFLSFNAKQINDLVLNANESRLLSKFLSQASQRGIKVELLLGDPRWALEERESLIKIITDLSKFGFSGIQLDIEKLQLQPKEQSLWDTGIVKTIKEVRAHTNLPIGLSLNYKEAEDSKFLDNLYKAGLSEVVIMFYTTNTDRIKQIITPIIKAHPELSFSVAQSIEPTTILPPDETYAKKGKEGALKSWIKLYQYFSKFTNFKGIIVQSLEDFLGAKK